MYVEVPAGTGPGQYSGVLSAAVPRAAVGRAGRPGRAAAEGAGRAGAAAADVADRLPPRRRGLRLRPERRVRPVPADDQPSPEGAARGRAAGPREAWRVGLLPGPDRCVGQPWRAHRRPILLTRPGVTSHSPGQETARSGQTAAHRSDNRLAFIPGDAAAAADRCQNTGHVPVSADWLRLARVARMLSWITLAWMGIEGGVAIAAAVMAGS